MGLQVPPVTLELTWFPVAGVWPVGPYCLVWGFELWPDLATMHAGPRKEMTSKLLFKGFGFRVLKFGLRVSGFRLWVSISGFDLQDSHGAEKVCHVIWPFDAARLAKARPTLGL